MAYHTETATSRIMHRLPVHREESAPCKRAMLTQDCPRQHDYKKMYWNDVRVDTIEFGLWSTLEGTVMFDAGDVGGRLLLENLELR